MALTKLLLRAKIQVIFFSESRIMGVRDGAIVYFDGVLKLLGVTHGMFGGLLIILGIVVRLVVDHWTSIMLLALWIGVIVSTLTAIVSCSDLHDQSIDIPYR